MKNLKLKKKIIKIKKVIILAKNIINLYIMHAQSLRKNFKNKPKINDVFFLRET